MGEFLTERQRCYNCRIFFDSTIKNEIKRVEISESETLPFNSQLVRVQAVGHWPKLWKIEITFDYRETAVYVSWKQHMANEKLYGNLLRTKSVTVECGLVAVTREVSKKVLHQFILRDSNCEKRSRHARTFNDQLIYDTGIRKEELA